jgi:hypothetical protein
MRRVPDVRGDGGRRAGGERADRGAADDGAAQVEVDRRRGGGGGAALRTVAERVIAVVSSGDAGVQVVAA